ncbi:GAF domain-containing protein, partial [Candidatus Ozemobacteraceae bacterium]|nr:GAF domain-containing protein [Candidatus Ozemobacteraceae bacterium]
MRTDTPETSQCERALKASEAKYRTFFETVHDAAFVADVATGTILEANRQAQNMLGWSLDEFRMKTYLDVLIPASREEGKRLFELDNKEIAGKTYELTMMHRDGTPVPVQGSTMLYVDEIGRRLSFGIFHDLRERRSKEAALQLEEARLEAVLKLNQMPATNFDALADFSLEEAVRLTSSHYGFLALLSADGATASLYCLSASALRDCRIPVLPTQLNVKMSGIRAEAIRRRKPMLLNGLPGDGIGDLAIPEGHVPINRLLLTPILDRENVVLLAGVANKEALYDDSDVRQLTLLMSEMWSVYTRRKAEEEGRQLESQMKHVQKLESLGVLAGGIAHDFNNILMAILGHVDLVRMSLPPDHEIQGHLEPIVTASKRAAELCRQMLAYAG